MLVENDHNLIVAKMFLTYTLLPAPGENIESIKRYFLTFPFQDDFVSHLMFL